MTTTIHPLTAARAEALFVSDLSATSRPSRPEIATAISRSVRRHGGTRGCAMAVAAEYGDHPETAVARMRWALATVTAAYADVERPTPLPRRPIPPVVADTVVRAVA